MAITLTQDELSAAIRLGDSAEENAESARLLAYVTAAISTHLGTSYEDAPEAVVNEAAIRLAGYLFDQPNAGRGLSFANAGRNSGAWAILLPFRVHRAGSTGETISRRRRLSAPTGNPVTGLAITVSGKLEVIFADGATVELDLPAGMGGGVLDQTARDSAAAAQTAADDATTSAANAQAAANSASDTAAAAQGTANNAATAATAAADIANANTGRLDAFPAGTGGVDQTARDAAGGSAIDGRRRDNGGGGGAVRHRRARGPRRTTRTARPERRRRRHRGVPMMPIR